MWYCNVILKARQLGISTFICLLFLDRCLFNDNMSAGIIAHTLEDAQQMFRRVKLAYDCLPDSLKELITAENDTANMLKFSNGSTIRVGTSLRSSTFQYLHISEFGKICAKYPDKAEEIITGSLNTVASGQYVFIESTAEGRDGYFYDICKRSLQDKQMKKELSKLDFRFHFFPWYKESTYRIGNSPRISDELSLYFDQIKNMGIVLDEEQKAWYAARESTQTDYMRREYPTTPEEAWEVTHEGLYYSKQMTMVRSEKRIGNIPYDESLPVYTAWDLGFNDCTAIWFFQVHQKEIRLIDYVEGSGESLAFWLGVIKNKDYSYEKHLAPHDILVHEYTSGMTRQASARKMGINLIPVPKVEIIPGIDAVRGMLNRCWFDQKKCEKGIKALDSYKKEWDERIASWRSQPLHNWASHGCFTGDTLILTRLGPLPIMLIQKDMEILTLKGWKKCNQATVTKRNAKLVEVKLSDGMNVRCTPDHFFLTEKGWISAKNLKKGIKIQSSLIYSQHILKAVYTEFGLKKDISKKAVHICTEMFGKTLLGKFLKNVISIIETEISKITNYQIWNVCQIQSISNLKGQMLNQYLIKLEKRQENGINLKKEENGIEDKPSGYGAGLNGKEKRKNVQFAKKVINLLLEKVGIRRNIVQSNANPLHVLGVKKIDETEDVYCINVPEIHHFSLANGAIVHNSDAFRTLATGLSLISHHMTVEDMQKQNHRAFEYRKNRFHIA